MGNKQFARGISPLCIADVIHAVKFDPVATDGCTFEYTAPQVMVIEPGHDAWVVGDEPAVLIEFDFERDTIATLGLRGRHEHGA